MIRIILGSNGFTAFTAPGNDHFQDIKMIYEHPIRIQKREFFITVAWRYYLSKALKHFTDMKRDHDEKKKHMYKILNVKNNLPLD